MLMVHAAWPVLPRVQCDVTALANAQFCILSVSRAA